MQTPIWTYKKDFLDFKNCEKCKKVLKKGVVTQLEFFNTSNIFRKCKIFLKMFSFSKMDSPLWPDKKHNKNKKLCVTSVLIAFTIGLSLGILIPIVYFCKNTKNTNTTIPTELISKIFLNNSHAYQKEEKNFNSVTFIETDGVIEDDIFWGKKVENALPKGYGDDENEKWRNYVDNAVAIRLEEGCGRMQNRLVTFQDGVKGCVRYRQNLDQIQGELFSFYLAQLLNLPNLAPSTVSLVDLTLKTWQYLSSYIASAQWNSNRPIVITKFISNLSTANIPKKFRPPETGLSHRELLRRNESQNLKEYAELAQWSDLVIFDYLTANLDRVVNNLYNKQWNANMMEAPAHNLAKRMDDLLVFLDNESGLLHGYRVLRKYEPYHALLLENLCIFRRKTVLALEKLRREQNIEKLFKDMFEKNTDKKIRDYLPLLPRKSIKILNERLEKVHNQINKCRKKL